MNKKELNKILENHKHWMNKDVEGWENMRADLQSADLQSADLQSADLDCLVSCDPENWNTKEIERRLLRMTNRETIWYMKNELACVRNTECDRDCKKCNLVVDQNSLEEAFETAIAALESAEKYRWHDLRKDKEDLPEKCGMYYTYTRINVHEKGYCILEFDGIGFECSELVGDTLAWREIEPFEGS